LLSPPTAKAKWAPVRVKTSRHDESALDPARLFAGFESLSGLVLAVSGGPDSLALMVLAAQWRENAGPVPLFVATVDHGLREDSGTEAEKVGEWAAALGLPHAILPWRGEKPTRALQEKARAARYGLLFAYAKAVGAEAVATAHHADDQWETLLFRLARGSGLAGLAGMARDQPFSGNEAVPGGRLIRPLLGLPKQALIDFCRARGQRFFDDPSNANPDYARTRLRALAAPLHKLGFDRAKALKLAERARKTDGALDWAAKEAFRRAALPEKNLYDLTSLEKAPLALFERFLTLALTCAAGVPPQRLDRLESLVENMSLALKNGQNLRATLGGCVVVLNRDRKLALRRESPRNRGCKPQA
jgi:tRNA(Ile)-lysidine synthase